MTYEKIVKSLVIREKHLKIKMTILVNQIEHYFKKNKSIQCWQTSFVDSG